MAQYDTRIDALRIEGREIYLLIDAGGTLDQQRTDPKNETVGSGKRKIEVEVFRGRCAGPRIGQTPCVVDGRVVELSRRNGGKFNFNLAPRDRIADAVRPTAFGNMNSRRTSRRLGRLRCN